VSHQVNEFQDEQFALVCERMAEGETLSAICKEADTPSRATFLRWVKNDTGRTKAYQLARQAQADFYFDQIKDLAFDSSNDTVVNERGTAVCNHEWVARTRVKVDSLKWIASKLDPVKFGDRMPEAIAAKEMDAEQQQQIADQNKITRIERIILRGVVAGDMKQEADGNWVPTDAADLRAQIAELKAQLAGRNDPAPTPPPALIEYDPGLPRRMDSEIATRLVRLIRDHVPVDGNRDPAAVLDEILIVCRNALQIHFGPTGELMEISLASA
jgi:hypothetical protein